MFSKILGFSLLTLAAAQSLPINITAPSPQIWFVADSLNTISWGPCTGPVSQAHPLLNMIVNNKDQSVLIGNLTVLGAVPSFDCSKSFTPTNLPPASGYQMFFTDSTSAEVVAISGEFEVMPQGSAYATVTTSSDSGPTSTGSGSPQQSGSSNSTSPNKNGAASSFSFSGVQKMGVALAGVAGVAVTLF